MMATVSTSETPINFYKTTRRKIPEDSHLREQKRISNQYGHHSTPGKKH
jgi:hypothetical protein